MAFRQVNQDTADSVANVFTLAFDSDLLANSNAFVSFRIASGTVTVVSVVGSRNGAYTRDWGPVAILNQVTGHHFRRSSVAAGSETISVTLSADSTLRCIVTEYTAPLAAALDRTAEATGTSTTPSSGNTSTTSAAVETILGLIFTEDSLTFTAGASFTNRTEFASERIYLEDREVSSAAAYAATGTLSISDTWYAVCLTYMAGGSPVSIAVPAGSEPFTGRTLGLGLGIGMPDVP